MKMSILMMMNMKMRMNMKMKMRNTMKMKTKKMRIGKRIIEIVVKELKMPQKDWDTLLI